MVRGPKSPSFIYGNLLEVFQRPAGEADFRWQNLYGRVIRFKGVFGEDRLMISDPRAVHKILHTSDYTYCKLQTSRVISRLLNGKGITWSDGDIHKRQKSIMLPGFGPKETKEFSPIFKQCAESITTEWLETIGNSNDERVILNVLDWLSRGALDIIGQAAFDVQFDTFSLAGSPGCSSNLTPVATSSVLPPANQIFFQAAAMYVPVWILEWITDHSPHPRLVRARNAKIMVTEVARQLVREKADALLQGKGNRDIFTLLVKANMDANAKHKLSDEELYAQMRALLITGHETTANTTSFILLELARHPKVQSSLRDEIRKTTGTVILQANGEPHLPNFDAMLYLNAVIKEGLRFHPIASSVQRIASRDDILPLSKPIRTESGAVIDEMLVPKGTQVMISIAAYNRDTDIWGQDAHDFNPDRWLDGTLDKKLSAGLGVLANLLTFGSGTRACLAWRFALMEIQAFLVELVGKFEFTMTDKAERIVRESATLIMAPMVDGERDRGMQMPLAVSLASQDTTI
ncbi:cytochrome P450 [Chiua virens]|nr:cytochrome P450 [Chiua virens]